MQKSGCSKQKPPAQWRPRNGDISLSQRFLKMGASTTDCIPQRAESIPELLNHKEHGYEIQIARQERTAAQMFDLAADTFIRNGDAKFLLIPPSNERHLI